MRTNELGDINQDFAPFKAIFYGGLLCGILDITAACVTNYWISPIVIFQSVASGILGKESYKGGMKTAVLGLFLHFIIAFGAAIVYYLASRKIRLLLEKPLISGAIYGVGVYWFMQLVVLPLSAFPGKSGFGLKQTIIGLIVHIFFVGLPIALVVRKYSVKARFG